MARFAGILHQKMVGHMGKQLEEESYGVHIRDLLTRFRSNSDLFYYLS